MAASRENCPEGVLNDVTLAAGKLVCLFALHFTVPKV